MRYGNTRGCIGVQRLGGYIIGNNAMCVALCRCVLLLGVWGYGPQEKLLLFMLYKVMSEAILDYLSRFVRKYITAVIYVQ